eukprot:TRINITY_DN9784_c0_g1_i1.p1 TRINITY_DN9784_c0_g1~~TRINITY_DN9784_c0_g1_i1.p1  ORF type:complete len:595 (+),score=70.63 TRINITY_DN9784_c0_g1_i1:848-2632(+)
MSTSAGEVVLFAAIHDNHVESLAALAANFPLIVYQYPWHACPTESRAFFEGLNCTVKNFSIHTMVDNIVSENRRVVFIITASLHTRVGASQQRIFESLRALIPGKIIDVFHAYHCMYGCSQHQPHRHPLMFSRFKAGTLGIDPSTLRSTLGVNRSPVVLVSPSVFERSFLYDDVVLRGVVGLIAELRGSAQFCVKLHPHCYHTNPLVDSVYASLNAPRIKQNIVLLAQAAPHIAFYSNGWSTLPAIELADIIIGDVESSVPFEALAFPGKTLLLYHPARLPEYTDSAGEFYNVFRDVPQLRAMLLSRLQQGEIDLVATSTASGTYFASKYDEVTGFEALSVAQARGWFAPHEGTTDAAAEPLITAAAEAMAVEGRPGLSPDAKLLLGLIKPEDLTKAWRQRYFEFAHQPQLEAASFPLWLIGDLFAALYTPPAFSDWLQIDVHANLVRVVAKKDIPASTVLVFPHMWTTVTPTEAELTDTRVQANVLQVLSALEESTATSAPALFLQAKKWLRNFSVSDAGRAYQGMCLLAAPGAAIRSATESLVANARYATLLFRPAASNPESPQRAFVAILWMLCNVAVGDEVVVADPRFAP